MVSRLQINTYHGYWETDECNKKWHEAVLVPAVSLALSAAADTGPQVGAEWQLRPLGPQSYSSSTLHDSAVLQALPVASLTHLDISGGSASGLEAGMKKLTNLQVLSSTWVEGGLAGYLVALAQLSRLTALTLSRSLQAEDWNKYIVACHCVDYLPSQLLKLDLTLGDASLKESNMVDLSQLTRLTSCKIEVIGSAGSLRWQLPTQLVELSLCHACGEGDSPSRTSSAFNLSSLMQLQHLWLGGTTVTPEDLLQVGRLPKLRSLALKYTLQNEKKGQGSSTNMAEVETAAESSSGALPQSRLNREEAASLGLGSASGKCVWTHAAVGAQLLSGTTSRSGSFLPRGCQTAIVATIAHLCI